MTAARLEAALREASPDALVAYVTGGYPTPERFMDVLREVAANADAVEIGVPFSDPMADGVTRQQTSAAALAAGATLTDLLDRLGDAAIDTPLVLMSYLNPLLALGPELVPRLVAAGISGLVVPDLPAEECDGLDHALAAHGLALIQLVAPTTPLNRARELAARSRGFVYVVTGLGVTGGDAAFTADLEARMAALREAATAPVLAGFGIRRAEQLRALRPHADGAIVGSALMRVLTRGERPAPFLLSLRSPS